LEQHPHSLFLQQTFCGGTIPGGNTDEFVSPRKMGDQREASVTAGKMKANSMIKPFFIF